MSTTHHGLVSGVYADDLGDQLVVAAGIGATTLQVKDVADFDIEDGGYLVLNDTILQYESCDDDLSTITLTAPLVAAAAIDDRVDVWDEENGTKATIYKAVISDFDGFPVVNPLTAIVPQQNLAALRQAMRDGKGEGVSLLREDDGTLTVDRIDGRNNALASLQYLQGGITTRIDETVAGVDILGVDSGTPGVYVNGDGGVLGVDGQGMAILADAAGGVLKFWTGGSGETGPGWVNPKYDTFGNKPTLEIASPATVSGRAKVIVSSAYVEVDGGPFLVLGDTIETDGIFLDNPPTTTIGSANVKLGAAGQQLVTVSSLSRLKLEQKPLSAEAVEGILKLTPSTWFDRAEVEANDGDTEGLRRGVGFIAEDVAEHVPDLATYEPDGTLQGVAYDRVAAYLIPLVAQQRDQIAELTARLDRLEKESR